MFQVVGKKQLLEWFSLECRSLVGFLTSVADEISVGILSIWGVDRVEAGIGRVGVGRSSIGYRQPGRSLSPSFFPDRGEMPKNPKFLLFY